MQKRVPLTLIEGYRIEAWKLTDTTHFSVLDLVGLNLKICKLDLPLMVADFSGVKVEEGCSEEERKNEGKKEKLVFFLYFASSQSQSKKWKLLIGCKR